MWATSGENKERRDEVKRVKVVFQTDRGKVRTHNEDNGGVFYNKDADCLVMVADGMGGHNAGDVASGMTKQKLKMLWESAGAINTPEVAEKWLKESITTVNNEVFSHSKSHEECAGMGTTIVAAICAKGFFSIANIGDSRGYIFNESGFKQLTEDHSLVNELMRSGQISREEAEKHPRKNVLLRALGTEDNVHIDVKTITFEKGDLLLLCSDGLSNKVTEQEMKEILTQPHSLEDKVEQLVHLANEKGGEDNITILIVENEDDEKSGEASC